jgi:hypothetical protein
MSYCRFGPESDLYVYLDCAGYLCCCACQLDGHPTAFQTTEALIDHVREHIQIGHKVPPDLIDKLTIDAEETDKWIAEFDPEKEGIF